MYVQIVTFAGPRSADLVAASERAGRDRIAPLTQSHPDLRDRLLGSVRAVGPDGHEVVITFATDEGVFARLRDLIMNSDLLPGEDPGLLPGPTSVEHYPVTDVFGRLISLVEGALR